MADTKTDKVKEEKKAEADAKVLFAHEVRYFENFWGEGKHYHNNADFQAFVNSVAAGVKSHYAPTTLLDVGCATGMFVLAFRAVGIKATGIDSSKYAIENSLEPDYCTLVEVSDAPVTLGDSQFEVITCIEVLEHIPNAKASVQALCTLKTDTILFSSTVEGNAEEVGHVSCKTKEQWLELFSQNGFEFVRMLPWITAWAMELKRV